LFFTLKKKDIKIIQSRTQRNRGINMRTKNLISLN